MKEQFIRKENYCMNNKDVKEWIEIADSDFDSAKILNAAVRKHNEIICYHCTQAVEKYLKGFLIYYDIIPQKTHDLLLLTNLCIEKNNEFGSIIPLCIFLNNFVNDIRYPHKYEITKDDVDFAIKAVEKIRNIKPITELINNINN